MHFDLHSHIQSFTKQFPAEKYFLAVSGGADSMALLHVFSSLQLPIEVLHVNYHLRGNDSDLDQKLVEDFCGKKKIPFHIHSVFLKEKLKQGGNLQALARQERYTFFEKKQNEYPNSYVVLAHHQNDQIETFWLQLLRNSGMLGLAGMKEQNGIYLRPFLSISKEELVKYLEENQVIWREDVSNAKNDYLRNRLRNEVLPALKSTLPDLNENVRLLQSVFRENITEKENFLKIELEKSKISEKLSLEFVQKLDETAILLLFRSFNIPNHQLKGFLHLLTAPTGTKITWLSEGEKQTLVREKSHLQWLKNIDFPLPKIHSEKVEHLPHQFSKSILYLDADKIKGELSVRFWQIGDRISPPGMKGSKLISDILKDAGVPHAERKKALVLQDEEKLLACINIAVDRSTLATKNTTSILKVWVE